MSTSHSRYQGGVKRQMSHVVSASAHAPPKIHNRNSLRQSYRPRGTSRDPSGSGLRREKLLRVSLRQAKMLGPPRVAVQTHTTVLKNHGATLLAFKVPQDAAGVDGDLDHDICVFVRTGRVYPPPGVCNVDLPRCAHRKDHFRVNSKVLQLAQK